MLTHAARPRVLFVDDEPAVLDGLRRALNDCSALWELHFESDSRRARQLAQDIVFQVIVTDLKMPGLNGLDLVAQLRAHGCSAVCMVLTGTGDLAAALDAINRGGVFRFYTKPCAPAVLRQGIAEAVAHAQHASDATRLAVAALDQLPFAAIALDRRFRPIFLNRFGAQLLSTADVLRVDGGGICRAAAIGDTAALHAAVEATAADGDSRVLGLAGREGLRYSVLIEAPAAEEEGLAALVFVREIDTRTLPPPDTLCRLFDLNLSEARLAHSLASGLDLKEAAEAQGITLSSARTYLKRLFQKTGANRQAELVRLLLNALGGL